MQTEQNQVREFMLLAGQETPAQPTQPKDGVLMLRTNLIQEELNELTLAFGDPETMLVEQGTCTYNQTEVADALADLLVVVLGTAVACGIQIQPIFDEVMRSNMTKFIDGHRREDGKWIKGPSYSPANISPLLEAQSR